MPNSSCSATIDASNAPCSDALPCPSPHLLNLPEELLCLIAEHLAADGYSKRGHDVCEDDQDDHEDDASTFDLNDHDASDASAVAHHGCVPVRSTVARTLVALCETCTTWERVVNTVLRWHVALSLDIAWNRTLPHPTYFRLDIAPSCDGVSWTPELFVEERPFACELTPIRAVTSPTTVVAASAEGSRDVLRINADRVRSVHLERLWRPNAGPVENASNIQLAHLGLSTILARMAARFRHLAMLSIDAVLPASSLVLALGILSSTLHVLSTTVNGNWNEAATMVTLPHLRKLDLTVHNADPDHALVQTLISAPRLNVLRFRADAIHPDLVAYHLLQFSDLHELDVKGTLVYLSDDVVATAPSATAPSATAPSWSALRTLLLPAPIFAHMLAACRELSLPCLVTLGIAGNADSRSQLASPRWPVMPKLALAEFKNMVVPPSLFATLAHAAPRLTQLEVVDCSLVPNCSLPGQFTFPAITHLRVSSVDVASFFASSAAAPVLTTVEVHADEPEPRLLPSLPWTSVESLTVTSMSVPPVVCGADLDALPWLTALSLPVMDWANNDLPVLNSVTHLAAPATTISALAMGMRARNVASLAVTIHDGPLRAVPEHTPLRHVLAPLVEPAVLSMLSRMVALETVNMRAVAAPRGMPVPLVLEYRSKHPLWRALPKLAMRSRVVSALVVRVEAVGDVATAASEIVSVAQWAAGSRMGLSGDRARPAWAPWAKALGRTILPVQVLVGNDAPVRDQLLTVFGKLDPKRIAARVITSPREE
ncbi:hypothetical protein AMAG_08249 [Allomyces macrogynus ATCC 38327]|uniref:Uncharacterized protein n=1 Tax=Allomyces macrogynus (strain ATCC 38327) TaxID=578462 RepID=A0A0L0SKX1_ALLM3|nr:hypothetical protein AMAG_08249 [Allomyces macrogynus ATCC 38327]|eukprot:KNE63083.1 hypothetical protein AMAG_08249 [Allomyces macrogynus ATCC 38327]